MLSVGRRTAGVDHVKLRDLLLITSQPCDLQRLVNERIIDYQVMSDLRMAHDTPGTDVSGVRENKHG